MNPTFIPEEKPLLERPYMIVDDQEPIAQLVKLSLERVLNIPSDVYTDSLRALEQFKQYAPPFVITDKVMPGLSGLDLYRQTHHLSPQTKYLFISGTLVDPDVAPFMLETNLPKYHFLPKPFTTTELVNAINKIRGA